MNENDHTVNINRRYHHGDLRAALLRAGLALISTRETDELSLREVAREVGVSANSVYRHFPDKQALMSALAEEGLSRLGAAQKAAAEASGGGPSGFAATGKAYVKFAIENPALFRMIFANAGYRGNGLDGPNQPAQQLRANAAAVTADSAEAHALALRAWSLVHGLAMLILDGQLEFSEALLDQVLAYPRSWNGLPTITTTTLLSKKS